jgi:hypothetical protein
MRGDMLDGLVAYWKLDEASGSRADTVGGYTLTDNNTVTQTTGIISNAASFAAASSESLSYATADDDVFEINKVLYSRFSLWFKATSLPANGNSMTLLAKEDGGGDPSYILDIFTTGGVTKIRVRAEGLVVGASTLTSTTTLSTGTWYHAVFGYRLSSIGTPHCTLYVNGANEAYDETIDITSDILAGGVFYLGRDTDGNYFNGAIDEVGFWQRELSASEVTDLYGAGSGLAYPLRVGPPTFRRTRGLR